MDQLHENKEKTMISRILFVAALIAVMLSTGELSAEVITTKVLIEQADAARKEAASIGYEWRDTASLITKAKEALANGQEEDAQKLARKALIEGQQALEQGRLMSKQWEIYIPKS